MASALPLRGALLLRLAPSAARRCSSAAAPAAASAAAAEEEKMEAARASVRTALSARRPASSAEKMTALIDATGSVLAVQSEDEASLPRVAADAITPEAARRATQAFAYHARSVRANMEPLDLDLYSAALEREFGSELEMADPLAGAVRPDDYADGADPLLDGAAGLPFAVNALEFRTHMTWNASPGSRKIDRRALLKCIVADLKLPPATAQYVRTIAAGHYDGRTDRLRISVDQHPDAGLNKRLALEQLVALVSEAQALADKHGPFKPVRRFPAYSY